jgi:hypothetical protein
MQLRNAARPEGEVEDEEIAELKKQVRYAMAVLEEGRAVAAFNLLNRIVGNYFKRPNRAI